MTITKNKFEVTVKYVVTGRDDMTKDQLNHRSAQNIVLNDTNSELIESVTVIQVQQIAVDENT